MYHSALQAWLDGAHKRYKSIKELLENSRNNPNPEFQVRVEKILLQMERELIDFESNEPEVSYQLCMISALLKYELGKIIFQKAPEPAEKCLKDAWDIIVEHSSNPDCVFLSICILKELSTLLAQMYRFMEAEEYLTESQRILEKFDYDTNPRILLLEDLFLDKISQQEAAASDVELIHYQTLKRMYSDGLVQYWMAVVKKNAEEENNKPLQWLQVIIDFFNVLIISKKFCLSRHVLSCATLLSEECKKTFKRKYEDDDETWIKLNRLCADVSCCWGFYATYLLECSRKTKQLGKPQEEPFSPEVDTVFLTVFISYKLSSENEVKEIENKVTYNLASNYEEAKGIFLFGQKQLGFAAKYYNLIEDSSDYIVVMQNLSKLYVHLIFFESEHNPKSEMYICAIDLLETALLKVNEELHPKLYQELLFELGELHRHLAYAKRESVGDVEDPEQGKVNDLATKAIQYLQYFFNSLRNADGVLPLTLPDDVAASALEAYMYLGDLYIMMFGDGAVVTANMVTAQGFYQDIINYLGTNPGHEKYIWSKLPMIKQKIAMIPRSIEGVIEAQIDSIKFIP